MVNEKRCLQQKAALFTPSKHPAWLLIPVSCPAELLLIVLELLSIPNTWGPSHAWGRGVQ